MTSTASLDSIYTCKICNHNLARDCIDSACNCCKESNHAMVMDGIEGFLPQQGKKGDEQRY